MREFVITPEMKEDAKADKREMMRLRDEIERAGFLFEGPDSFNPVQPCEIITRDDGHVVWRQRQKH